MKTPTIKDVAKRSGVGIGTVSRVLNGNSQISEKTKQKVLQAIEELHYSPNMIGKKLSQNRSYLIAVVVPVITHPFFANLVESIEVEADNKKYSILLATSQHRIEKEREILQRISHKEADGAIFITHYEHNEEEFKNLAIVSIDRHLGKDIPIVTTNNYEASKQAMEYLYKHGSKRIAFLGSKPTSASEVSYREQAYIDFAKEKDIKPIIVNEVVEHHEEGALVDKIVKEYPNYDGVFVSNCTLARILVKKLKAMNVRVPEDVQVLSYDGDFERNSFYKMSSMRQPIDLMAKKCVELLIKLINKEEINEKKYVFDCQFVKGETTY